MKFTRIFIFSYKTLAEIFSVPRVIDARACMTVYVCVLRASFVLEHNAIAGSFSKNFFD